MKKKYYEAYNERYKTIHKKGFSWSSNIATPIVLETIKKLNISKEDKLLEIGCGEGRDAKTILEQGYNLLATDISLEAIDYCKAMMPSFSNHFTVLDCLNDDNTGKYHFIFAVAVIHMLVLDEDHVTVLLSAFSGYTVETSWNVSPTEVTFVDGLTLTDVGKTSSPATLALT